MKMKKHTRTGVLSMSPLGYDGSLPAVKKSSWTRNGPRLTAGGSDAVLELGRRAVTAPRHHLWNGLRVQNNPEEKEKRMSKKEQAGVEKKLFASKTIPRSWKLPNFDSPW